jgi:spore coat polysaccharide biosynthesis protein SpsF
VNVVAIVQARMSSARFPGKVLAPFRGRPIVRHVVEAATRAVGSENVVVATSDQESDDPLVAYLATLGVRTFRGPLDDVLERFCRCARAYPADWIARICADSPVLDPAVIQRVVGAARPDCDVVTTTFPHRTHPLGSNVELIRASALLSLPADELTADDREHVTRFFYRNAERFRIVSVELPGGALPGQDVAVDTVEDLRELEASWAR